MRKNKQTIVILEGVDAVGKTTVKKELEKLSNWQYIVLDRFVGSDIVYDNIYKRGDREELLFKLEKDLQKISNLVLVYLIADKKIIYERLKARNEKINKKRIDKEMGLYGYYYFNSEIKKTTILDTSNSTPSQIASKIIKFITTGKDDEI